MHNLFLSLGAGIYKSSKDAEYFKSARYDICYVGLRVGTQCHRGTWALLRPAADTPCVGFGLGTPGGAPPAGGGLHSRPT